MAGVDNAMNWETSNPESTAQLFQAIKQLTEQIETTGKRDGGKDFFSPSLESQRGQCRDLFRRLIVRNPYSSNRKDLIGKLWFVLIYRVIDHYRVELKGLDGRLSWTPERERLCAEEKKKAASQNRRPRPQLMRESEETLAMVKKQASEIRGRLRTFLQEMAGFLLMLVVELAEQHELVVTGELINTSQFAIDYRTLATHAYGYEFVDALHAEARGALSLPRKSAVAIIAQCLVYLGDLSRYRVMYTSRKQTAVMAARTVANSETDQQQQQQQQRDMWWAAKKFYQGAIKLAPHRGQPHNQLAVIYGHDKDYLSAIFGYYRATTAHTRFIASESNMRGMLDNAQRLLSANVPPIPDRPPNAHWFADSQIYPNFTMLRCHLAQYQPSTKSPSDMGTSVMREAMPTKEHVRSIANRVDNAVEKFVRTAKATGTGSLDGEQVMMVQIVHLLELQRLTCFGNIADGSHLPPLNIVRQSANLAVRVAESFCHAISRSIADSRRTWRTLKSEQEVLTKPSRRVIGPLIVSLVMFVSLAVRIKRSKDQDSPHIQRLRTEVFAACERARFAETVSRLKRTMSSVHHTVNRRSQSPEPLQWRTVCRSMAPLAVRLWGEHVACSGQRIEDRMLAGWAMPDGTVWGRVPSSYAEMDISNIGNAALLSEKTEEKALLSRWWQLDCILALAAECLPDMVQTARIIDSRSQMPSGVVSNDMDVDTEEEGVGNSTSADDDADNAIEEDEEEIVFFRGRPQTALDRKVIEEKRPVLPARPPSRLLSPEQKQERRIQQRRNEYQKHQKQYQQAANSQTVTKTTPLARTLTRSPVERPVNSTPYVPLVDAERDEVIRPAVGQQQGQQHSQQPRVPNAIGSQRVPATASSASSSTTEAFSGSRIAGADEQLAMAGIGGLLQAARAHPQYRSPTALDMPIMPPMMPSASMHGLPGAGHSSSLTSPYANSSAHQSLLGSPVAPSQQHQQQTVVASSMWSPALRPSASQSVIGTTSSVLSPQHQQQPLNNGADDRNVLEKWQEYAQKLQEQTHYNEQLRQQLRQHMELRDRQLSTQEDDGDATAVSVASMALSQTSQPAKQQTRSFSSNFFSQQQQPPPPPPPLPQQQQLLAGSIAASISQHQQAYMQAMAGSNSGIYPWMQPMSQQQQQQQQQQPPLNLFNPPGRGVGTEIGGAHHPTLLQLSPLSPMHFSMLGSQASAADFAAASTPSASATRAAGSGAAAASQS